MALEVGDDHLLGGAARRHRQPRQPRAAAQLQHALPTHAQRAAAAAAVARAAPRRNVPAQQHARGPQAAPDAHAPVAAQLQPGERRTAAAIIFTLLQSEVDDLRSRLVAMEESAVAAEEWRGRVCGELDALRQRPGI